MYTEEELNASQMPSIHASIMRGTVVKLLEQKDRIIIEAVVRVLGRSPSNDELIKHGSRNVDTFGNETYYWDDKIIVEFPKQDYVVNRLGDFNSHCIVAQRYRLHV